MHKKNIIFVAVILALIVTYSFRNNYLSLPSTGSVSSNILYLTQPVTSFSGTIDKIEGNSITVSQNMTSQQAAPIQITPSLSKKITYKIQLTDKTNISRPSAFIPYLLKQITSPIGPMGQSEKLNVKDLKIGQVVSANSNIDLRTLKGSQFEATSINVSAKTISISGKIADVKSNQIIVKAVPNLNFPQPELRPINIELLNQRQPKEQNYTVAVNQNTEISKTLFTTDPTKPRKTERLSISDLKKNMQVTVYSDQDVTEVSQIKALLISTFSAP